MAATAKQRPNQPKRPNREARDFLLCSHYRTDIYQPAPARRGSRRADAPRDEAEAEAHPNHRQSDEPEADRPGGGDGLVVHRVHPRAVDPLLQQRDHQVEANVPAAHDVDLGVRRRAAGLCRTDRCHAIGLVFAELPDAYTWVGAALIVISGLIIAYRQARVGRRQTAGTRVRPVTYYLPQFLMGCGVLMILVAIALAII